VARESNRKFSLAGAARRPGASAREAGGSSQQEGKLHK
jgi:hypothetical protein